VITSRRLPGGRWGVAGIAVLLVGMAASLALEVADHHGSRSSPSPPTACSSRAPLVDPAAAHLGGPGGGAGGVPAAAHLGGPCPPKVAPPFQPGHADTAIFVASVTPGLRGFHRKGYEVG
jgi:hypothetical protein